MADTGLECRYFEHLVEYKLAICRECRYAVWPDQVEGHLHDQHKISRKKAGFVGEIVRDWPGLIRYPSELELPSGVIEPIAQLALYPDGLLCRRDPTRCRYIARSAESIRRHWREHHGWSAAGKRGRPSRTKEKMVQMQAEEGCKRVHCQRFFSSRHGSQYFEVQQSGEGQENGPQPVPVDGEAAWAEVGKEMAKAWAHIQKRAETTIQE